MCAGRSKVSRTIPTAATDALLAEVRCRSGPGEPPTTSLAAVQVAYVDGREVAMGPMRGPMSVPTTRGRIGRPIVDNRIYHGDVDEIMIFDRARTPEELAVDCG